MQNFETERLILRRWNNYDGDDFNEIYINTNITVPIGWGLCRDKKKSLKFLNMLINKESEWAIINKENNKAIGCIGYNYDTMRKGSIISRNIIYALNETYWGNGFCSEAVKRFIKFLFEDEGMEILCAHYFSYNLRSKKVLENCGFQYEGTIRMFMKTQNEINDYVLYSMTKSEYNQIYKVCT